MGIQGKKNKPKHKKACTLQADRVPSRKWSFGLRNLSAALYWRSLILTFPKGGVFSLCSFKELRMLLLSDTYEYVRYYVPLLGEIFPSASYNITTGHINDIPASRKNKGAWCTLQHTWKCQIAKGTCNSARNWAFNTPPARKSIRSCSHGCWCIPWMSHLFMSLVGKWCMQAY